MRLLLVRHGESICSVNGIVGGERGCTGLTDRGIAQARSLGKRFAAEGLVPEVFLASTLPRARQTAETIAAEVGGSVELDPDLREFIPGDVDGTPWSSFEGFDILAEPDRPFSMGGDSLSTFRSRVTSLLDRFSAAHDGRIVLAVCHGGVIVESMVRFFEVPNTRRLSIDVDFTSITEWRYDGHWHLARFNDVAHLVGTDLFVS